MFGILIGNFSCLDEDGIVGTPYNTTWQFNCDQRPGPVTHFPGHCIRKQWKCDGQLDCPNGSDEDIVACGKISCNNNA